MTVPPPPSPPPPPLPAAAAPRRAWRLSQVLAAVLYANTLLTFLLVSAGVLLWRLPALEALHQDQVEQQARQFLRREEVLLQALERQLGLLASALDHGPGTAPTGLLDAVVGDGRHMHALALVQPDGRLQALGLPERRRAQRADLAGVDLSRHPALQRARERGRITWGSMGPTALSPDSTLALVLPLHDGRTLWAEVALTVLLSSALEDGVVSHPDEEPRLWVVDADGELMADSQGGRAVGRINLLGAPWLRQAVPGQVQTFSEVRDGVRHHVAVVRSAALDWTFVAALPAGLAQPEVRDTLLVEAGSLAGALLIGLVLAPLVSRRLVGWLQAVVAQARDPQPPGIGGCGPAWQPTPVREFNLLAHRLGDLAGGLRERERQLRITFDAAPVPMAVTLLEPNECDMLLQDVNTAWCQQLGHDRAQVLGKSLQSLGLWADPLDGARAHAQAGDQARRVDLEARLQRGDGSTLQCHVTGRGAFLDQRWMVVWGMVDVTEQRRIEQALRELNQGLEGRVMRRTQDLVDTNERLRGALDHLRHTQDELLRSEKLAALGDLVAGVAHELGTPLGNTLMAVSTLADEVGGFRRGMQDGLRRSALDQLLDSVDQAMAISQRNLRRAANLVTSFKQVAVDQASAQRRPFSLDEMVRELVLTLKPSFSRTPYKIEVDVPAGVTLDSYPGALGQVLGNLINNARIHGFDGRGHGRIRLHGSTGDDGWITLVVEDDGVGVAPELADRIFDPFVTTRMGRGGTGLGLHIAHNAATRILGGTLELRSTPGTGTCFTLRIPRVAPAVVEPGTAASAADLPGATD
jgi:PAS domain S-box-containing protein